MILVHRALQLLFVLVFLAAISAPTLKRLASGPDTEALELEYRKPATAPGPIPFDSTFSEWRPRFESWFEDSFGFRTSLVFVHNYIKMILLGDSPSSFAVPGKDGFVFLARENIFDGLRGAHRFSDDALERWRGQLELRTEWLRRRGTTYLLFVAPNKHSIYSDKLPGSLVPRRVETPFDQWLGYLSAHSLVRPLDLRPTLLEERARGSLVYYPLGTHWTGHGAFAATRKLCTILSQWDPSLSPPVVDDFTVSAQGGPDDDMTQRLLLRGFLEQPRPQFERVSPPSVRAKHRAASPRVITFENQIRHDLPTALVFHDSFMDWMLQFLGDRFSRVTFVWARAFDPALIRSERPDVVIHQIVERFLSEPPYTQGGPLPVEDKMKFSALAGTWFNPTLGTLRITDYGGRLEARYQDTTYPVERAQRNSGRITLGDGSLGTFEVLSEGPGQRLLFQRQGSTVTFVATRLGFAVEGWPPDAGGAFRSEAPGSSMTVYAAPHHLHVFQDGLNPTASVALPQHGPLEVTLEAMQNLHLRFEPETGTSSSCWRASWPRGMTTRLLRSVGR